MEINLDGIDLFDATISVIDNERESIWFYTANQDCIKSLNNLPYAVHEARKNVFVIWPHTDTIALAERISLAWEGYGLKIKRELIVPSRSPIRIESFILA